MAQCPKGSGTGTHHSYSTSPGHKHSGATEPTRGATEGGRNRKQNVARESGRGKGRNYEKKTEKKKKIGVQKTREKKKKKKSVTRKVQGRGLNPGLLRRETVNLATGLPRSPTGTGLTAVETDRMCSQLCKTVEGNENRARVPCRN